jgi:hypothetical membrane protein
MDIKTWIRGNAGKMDYVKSISFALLILLAGIFIAALLYERPFSFLTVQISELAALRDNPIGGILFDTCFIVAGLIIIPHSLYLYKVMLPDVKQASRVSAAFVVASGIGIIMVGLFPSDIYFMEHIVGAILAFGGVGLSALFSLPAIAKKLLRKEEWLKPWAVLVTYGQLVAVVLATLFLVGIPCLDVILAGSHDFTAALLWWPMCEWLLLLGAVAWAVGMIYSAPKPR